MQEIKGVVVTCRNFLKKYILFASMAADHHYYGLKVDEKNDNRSYYCLTLYYVLRLNETMNSAAFIIWLRDIHWAFVIFWHVQTHSVLLLILQLMVCPISHELLTKRHLTYPLAFRKLLFASGRCISHALPAKSSPATPENLGGHGSFKAAQYSSYIWIN